MKLELLAVSVCFLICLITVHADSSEEASRNKGRVANLQVPDSSDSSDEDNVVVPQNNQYLGHCETITKVCASNGIIYGDYCEFKKARLTEKIHKVLCTRGHSIASPAVTLKPADITDSSLTTPRGENGSIDIGNGVATVPEPNCSEVCPLVFEPVCATDGKDYPNTCVFEASKCTGNTDNSVMIAYFGLCGSQVTNKPEITTSYRYCPDVCEDDISYVCGTDGLTYKNKCSLLKIACGGGNNMSGLDIAEEGQCLSEHVTVLQDGNSIEPMPTPAEKSQEITTVDPCVKPTCKVVLEPLCASDGKTYPSRCVFENINRCSNTKLEFMYDGECVAATTPVKCIPCPQLQLEPVCGTDNISYPSRCILEKYICESKLNIGVAYDGECVRGDI